VILFDCHDYLLNNKSHFSKAINWLFELIQTKINASSEGKNPWPGPHCNSFAKFEEVNNLSTKFLMSYGFLFFYPTVSFRGMFD
jgi:hypothetical protein